MGWKDEFVAVLLSNQQDGFKKALELKRQNLPAKLYRYRPLITQQQNTRLLNSIEEKQLYCASSRALNDPFESRSLLSSSKAADYFTNAANFRIALFEQLKEYFDENEFMQALNDKDWVSKTWQLVCDCPSPQQAAQLLDDSIMPQMESVLDSWNNILGMMKVASFSERMTCLPMWAHYAENHCGVCLEFDTSELSILGTNCLFPVNYVDELPDIVKFIMENFGSQDRLLPNMTFFYCINKLRDWSYESEWRFLLHPGLHPEMRHFRYREMPQDYLNSGISINFIKPSKIILGNRVEQSIQSELMEVARKQNIAISKMAITPYGLKEEQL